MRNEIRARVRERLAKIWWFVLLRGILMLILGLFFVTSPGSTLATLSLLLGIYWFVQGIFSILGIFIKASDVPWGWLLFEGIIGILAGIFVINNRMFVPTTLVIILAIQALMMGIINLVQGFQGDGSRAIILGSINILFGIILFGHPLVAASILPVIFGILAMVGGIVLIALTLRIRGAVK